jgi:hypothetical protein
VPFNDLADKKGPYISKPKQSKMPKEDEINNCLQLLRFGRDKSSQLTLHPGQRILSGSAVSK